MRQRHTARVQRPHGQIPYRFALVTDTLAQLGSEGVRAIAGPACAPAPADQLRARVRHQRLSLRLESDSPTPPVVRVSSNGDRECEPLQAPPARQLPSTITLCRPSSARGKVNIHVAKSPGTLPSNRVRLYTRQHCDPRVQPPLPGLHGVSIALVRVNDDLRKWANKARRYASIQISGQILGATCLAPRAGYWPRTRIRIDDPLRRPLLPGPCASATMTMTTGAAATASRADCPRRLGHEQ